MPLSTRVAAMSEGGGIIEDTDAVILRARYIGSNERPDYQKSIKDGKLQLLLAMVIVPFTPDGFGKAVEQLWTGGELSRIMPVDNGILLDRTPGAPPSASLTKTSNIGQLFQSWEIIDQVTDRDQPGVGITILEGFKVHFMRVPVKGREKLAVNIPGQEKKAPDVLLVSKVYGKDPALHAQLLAAEAQQHTSPAATPGAPQVPQVPQMASAAPQMPQVPQVGAAPALAPAPAPAAGGLDAEALRLILMEVVASGPVPKNGLATKAFPAVNAKWPNERNDYLRLLTSEGFLKSSPVNFDGTTVSAL